jgi:hypothetical protein
VKQELGGINSVVRGGKVEGDIGTVEALPWGPAGRQQEIQVYFVRGWSSQMQEIVGRLILSQTGHWRWRMIDHETYLDMAEARPNRVRVGLPGGRLPAHV